MAAANSLQVIKAGRRESRDFGWLRTSWLFSFDDYFDPENIEYGVLRVFNDDLIAPGKGFPAHRHSEMEIVTMVLEGRLTHRDSAGNEAFLGPGEVQRMTAGTGVLHSEMSAGHGPLHMYQMWFIPRRGMLKPSYQQGKYQLKERANELIPLVSGEGKAGALDMDSDATLYGVVLEEGNELECGGNGRMLFIYVTSGRLEVDGFVLNAGDQGRAGSGKLTMKGVEDAQFVVVEMPRGA